MTEKQKAYNKFITSPEWQAIKDNLFALREKKCEVCGSTKFIQGHHLTYKRFGGKEKPEDLQILCGHHHQVTHGIKSKKKRRKKTHRYYRRIAINNGLIPCGGNGWKKLARKLSYYQGTNRKQFNVSQAKKYVKMMLKDYL